MVDGLSLCSAESVRDRLPFLCQGDESASRIIGVGFSLQESQFDALRDKSGGAGLVDADLLADRADSEGASCLYESDEQLQLSPTSESSSELSAPVVPIIVASMLSVATVVLT